ncbi:MAG: polysaccharide biosynthesis/export family protein [Bacteroidales bacterium]|jgi:polysaccharide export outer membrane protein|nr:polysaccharide biosynthesis/export family protein [Bacteroidales bacterium]
MKRLHLLRKVTLIALMGMLALSSCVSHKKMLLLKDLAMVNKTNSIEYQNERSLSYRIQPGDNLYIKATNIIDEKNSGALNGESSRSYMSSDASIYLHSYTVNKEGYIDYPLIGLVEVKNLTVEETKYKLEKELSRFLKETALMVKLSNFDLTIIGEVQKPGKYRVYQSEINVFEALSLAGNLSSFANNSKVKLIRQTEKGSEVISLNIGKADILSSPYYYLKPNDIIYVEPLRLKRWGFTSFPYSTVLSIISLGLTSYTLVYNIINRN